MSTISPDDIRLRVSTEELCEILGRIGALHEEMLEVLSSQEKALTELRMDELDEIREREEKLIRRIIEEEKERLLLTEELGDLLEHEEPASIRVAEIVPFLPEDLMYELTESRNKLRDAALKLARQNAVNRALIEHSVGHIQIFMTQLAAEEAGGPAYDCHGEASNGGDSFLMDRRA